MSIETMCCGEANIALDIVDGCLRSIGEVSVHGIPLRNGLNRWLPWFDTLEGDVFATFRWLGIEQCGSRTVINLRAISNPDWPFRERRDSSGDICLRGSVWDAAPLEAHLRIHFEPTEATLDGRHFTGFRYWYSYDSEGIPIHRLLDRQTWELGGNLDDVTLLCRNLFDLPRKRIARDTGYSTVGLASPAGLMPGGLWPRWTLLPGFDVQYGNRGIFAAWFDQVACVRSVIESAPGEDWIRHVDLHYVENSCSVTTTPRSILWCPDVLDDVDALNLWTCMQDAEHRKASRQFNLPTEPPPALALSIGETRWSNYHFDRSYEDLIEVGAEFGCDFIGTDAVWENGEALRMALAERIPAATQSGTAMAKVLHQNMCCTLDFEVAKEFGGEEALQRLCERAAHRGLGVVIWLGLHVSPLSALQARTDLGHGQGGIFATKESSRHPDTGYPANCLTLNLHAPIGERVLEQVLGVCKRAGVSGIRWDSFCNLGWWQVDHSNGTCRPQFDRQAAFYGALMHAGIRVWTEAIVEFSNQSCCGLHGGDVYAGDLLGFSYNSAIPLGTLAGYSPEHDQAASMLTGEQSPDLLFRCFAHKRVPPFCFHTVPRERWNLAAAAVIKEYIQAYRAVRERMVERRVLHHDAGVVWYDPAHPDDSIYWCFDPAQAPAIRDGLDAVTGLQTPRNEWRSGRVYRLSAAVTRSVR